jgi:hypothetical protein
MINFATAKLLGFLHVRAQSFWESGNIYSKTHEQVGNEVLARASGSRGSSTASLYQKSVADVPGRKLGFGGPVRLRRCLMFGWRRLGIWASFADVKTRKIGDLLWREGDLPPRQVEETLARPVGDMRTKVSCRSHFGDMHFPYPQG